MRVSKSIMSTRQSKRLSAFFTMSESGVSSSDSRMLSLSLASVMRESSRCRLTTFWSSLLFTRIWSSA